MKKTNQPTIMLSASEIGQACFCPHSLLLQQAQQSKRAQRAMQRGARAHQKLGSRLQRQQPFSLNWRQWLRRLKNWIQL